MLFKYSYKCKCNKKCLKIYNVSSGEITFSCYGTSNKNANKKVIHDPENLANFCNFKKVIKIYQKPDVKKTKEIDKKLFDNYPRNKYILSQIDFFLNTKLYSTFQILELECKKENIKCYNPKKESMYEYTQRLRKHFT